MNSTSTLPHTEELSPTAVPAPRITAMDLVMDEVRLAVKKTQEYDALIKSAKTNTKKEYYRKKMKANNEYIMQALVLLERYKGVSDAADKMAEDKKVVAVDIETEAGVE